VAAVAFAVGWREHGPPIVGEKKAPLRSQS
jgi:hypothetical protein